MIGRKVKKKVKKIVVVLDGCCGIASVIGVMTQTTFGLKICVIILKCEDHVL